MRIAVIGANGQVGSEVCLLLAKQSGVELVPISRNRGGSAFLRYQGLPCRHGLVTDPEQAPKLIGDCDVVANFAWGSGSPRDARVANQKVIENSSAFSPAGARILYISTVAIYRTLHAGKGIGFRSAYAREKLSCEAASQRQGGKFGKEVYVLRLGHVTGELQNISLLLRNTIEHGPIQVPDPERKSNTTHVAAIVDAIMQIAKGRESPGRYDLLNVPQWTWRKVLEHEANSVGASLQLVPMASERGTRAQFLKAIVRKATNSAPIKEWGASIVARLQPELGDRLQAWHNKNRAAREIEALDTAGERLEVFRLNEVGTRFLSALSNTEVLLAEQDHHHCKHDGAGEWPLDLPETSCERAGLEKVLPARLEDRARDNRARP